MVQTSVLTGPEKAPASGKAKQLVIVLHGYGADGNDLIGLAPSLAAQLPHCAFAAPHASDRCEAGGPGRQWFTLADRHFETMYAEAQASVPVLDRYIDSQQEKWQVDDSKTVLLGFSQGTMMALQAGLRRQEQLAGIIGFSGVLVGADHLADDIKSKPPVLLVHGDFDDVVPYVAMKAAEMALKAQHIPVESLTCPGLGHSIDAPGLQAATHFLQQVLVSEAV